MDEAEAWEYNYERMMKQVARATKFSQITFSLQFLWVFQPMII